MKRGWLQGRKISLSVWLGLGLVVLVAAAAVLGPWIAPQDPYQQDLLRRLEKPSTEHLLGLDELGRDVLSRLIYGARVSVLVGVAVV
jgi:peptide/nickel transport system permease protein